MTRAQEIAQDLEAVRSRIREAMEAVSVSSDGRTLTRQGLDMLRQREAELTWQLQTALTRSPFSRTTFVRPGSAQSEVYFQGEQYGPGAPPVVVAFRSGGVDLTIELSGHAG